MFRYLPEQASEIAPKVDWLHNLITDLSLFFTVAIVGTMLYFAWKYRKRDGKDHETPRIEGDHRLELIWTVVPTIICIFIAYYGIIYYHDIRSVPTNALTINVTGQKWLWNFEYENGKKTTNEFVVPVDQPIRLLMQSRDVLHSFFIPSMRVKADVIPGRYTYVSFTPVKTGTYRSYCTEYCGRSHYNMLASLKVVSQGEYDSWLKDRSAEIKAKWKDPADLGAKLYVEKGCNACHSLDGSKVVGPSFKQLFGKDREFDDGTKVVADEEYLRESILYPGKKVVKGYQNGMMPAFEGQVSDQEMMSLIAFIKKQDGTAVPEIIVDEAEDDQVDLSKLSPAERGELLYQGKLCASCHSLDGSRVVGPSFKGIYQRKGKLADGTDYVANDEYLKKSILNPNAEVVEGYAPAMPQQQFSDEQVSDLVEYLKTLK